MKFSPDLGVGRCGMNCGKRGEWAWRTHGEGEKILVGNSVGRKSLDQFVY